MDNFGTVLRAFVQWLLDWLVPAKAPTQTTAVELPEVALQRERDENASLKAQIETGSAADKERQFTFDYYAAHPDKVFEHDKFEGRNGSGGNAPSASESGPKGGSNG